MRRTGLILIAVLLYAAPFSAQTTQALLDQAKNQFLTAQKLDAGLREKASAKPSRADLLKALNAYQRVYLITPHTGYADDALLAVGRLYEEMQDTANAVKTLKFLVHDYPQTPFKAAAERDITRLEKAREAAAAPVKADKTITVENVRYWEDQNSVRVVVDLSAEAVFTQGDAKDPDRVFIDIPSAKLSPSLLTRQFPVHSGLLQQIRVGQYDNSRVRVVLDVGSVDNVTSFTLRDPNRLIIDILGQAGGPPPRLTEGPGLGTTPTPPSARIASPPAMPAAMEIKTSPAVVVASSVPPPVSFPVVNIPAAAAGARAPTPAKPTNRGDTSLVRSLGLKITRVVIDAGHGGKDTGTIGPTGYTEKELALDVARRLKSLIETDLGVEVVMTRSDDVFLTLEARTAVANKHAADLFISIHANSSKVGTVRGVETFYLNYPPSRDSLELASRENASSESSIHDIEDIVKKIMSNDKATESRELAEHIQKAMAERKDAGPDRGVKEQTFRVLIDAKMPSILAEVGFISNPQEERAARTPAYRQQIAESLLKGIRSYVDTLGGVKTAEAPKNR